VTDLSGEEEQGKAYDRRLIGRLWTYVRPYRRVFWLAVLLSPVNQLFGLVQPYLLKLGIDRCIRQGDATGLRTIGLFFAAALFGEFASSYGQQYLTTLVAQRSLGDLRVALLTRVLGFPMRFFDATPVGRIVSRLTTDVDVLQEMFAAGAMTIALDGLRLAGIVGFMCWINWRLALTSLVLLPFMVLGVDFFRRAARRTYRLIRERIGRINGFLQEAITGMAAIALSAREPRMFEEFEALNSAHRDANHLSNKLEASLFSVVEAVSTVSIALMLWEGGRLHRVSLVEIGTVVAFIQYIQKFFVPIRDFSAKYAVMQSSMTAAERIFGILDLETEPVPEHPRVPVRVRGEIEFDRVWFAYKDPAHEDLAHKDFADGKGTPGAAAPAWVLRDVSFRISAGERVAIVGATGSGKTTLIKLLDRLYDVQRGRILVDGIDVRDWDPTALRRRIAVEHQLPCAADPGIAVTWMGFLNTSGEIPRLLLHEFAVQQRQGLGRNRGDIPARAAHRGIRLIENGQHGKWKRPLDVEVDAAPVAFQRIERHRPLIGRPHPGLLLFSKIRNHRSAGHLQIQHSGNVQHRVTKRFGIHTLPVHAPQVLV